MGSNRHFASQQSLGPNVRFTPKADMDQRRCDVRFVPKADIEWFIGRKKMAPTPVCRGQVRRRVRDDRHDKGGKERPRCQTPPYSTIIGWRRQSSAALKTLAL